MSNLTPELSAKIRKIKLAVFDVDGVMTDGRIHFDAEGNISKDFHIHDGLGLKLLQRSGVTVAVISGCNSKATTSRMAQLNIQHVFLKVEHKLPVLEALLEQLSTSWEQTLVVGDDWLDLPLLNRAGVAVTVPNARPEVLQKADYITQYHGGMGAVREVCQTIMHCQQTLAEVSLEYELNQ